jgi:hypothetical protein
MSRHLRAAASGVTPRRTATAAGYGGLYVALAALHAPWLRLPYYWDEAGYFIFAGLDFFRHGWLVPRTTLANGHPPLLSMYLALVWRVGGFHPLVTRLGMLGWATALVGGVYRLAERRMGRSAAIPALLVALTPLVFAQATLAQLDLPAAALIVWALVERERGRRWPAAGLLAAACLMKETAVIVPAVLWVWDARRGRVARPPFVDAALPPVGLGPSFAHRQRSPAGAPGVPKLPGKALLLAPAALAGWYLYFHHVTGYWIGNPEYVAYNVREAAFSLPRIGLALGRRVWQLGFYDGTGPLTAIAAGVVWRRRKGLRFEYWPLIAAYLGVHAIVGGAVLARYLLPALALYYVWLGEQIARLRGAAGWALVLGAWLVVGWFWNPPYPFPYEDNLAYATFVRLHQAAARALEADRPAGRVWTVWPATDELTRPELGYVTRPLAVGRLEDFSRASLASLPKKPETVYLFSREYAPRTNWAAARLWRRWAARYFGDRPAAAPRAWLKRARAQAWFQRARGGQWVEVARPGLARRAGASADPALVWAQLGGACGFSW